MVLSLGEWTLAAGHVVARHGVVAFLLIFGVVTFTP
jgi:hypothetical protein